MSTMSEIFEIMNVSSSHWLTIICTISAIQYSFIIMVIIVFGYFCNLTDLFQRPHYIIHLNSDNFKLRSPIFLLNFSYIPLL